MNATPSVSQAPIASDPAQQSAAAPVNSGISAGKDQDFAAALSSANAKPTRKAAEHRPADAGSAGGYLPAPGNLSPLSTLPPVAGSAAASASATIAGTPDGASMPGTDGGAATVAAAGAAAGTAEGTRAGTEVAAAPGSAAGTAAMSVALAQIVDQNSGRASVDSPLAAAGVQGAAGPRPGSALALGLPAELGEAAAPSAGAAAASTAAGVAAAAMNAATSRPSTHDAGTTASTTPSANAGTGANTGTGMNADTGTNTGTVANADAAAQAVTAAAMSAAATGAAAPGGGFAGGADSPSTPDDVATPAGGAVAHGARGPNGAPPAGPAISVSGTAAAARPKAAAAAPAVTSLASAGAADKRASAGAGDSLLSGTPAGDAAGAAQMSGNTAGVADATPTPTLKLTAGVETPEFGQGLADRVSWMVDNNLNGAKLQVNPPQLGPIEVRIAVQGNHAQVWLASHSAVTRDALESSSPKLREMLGAQGFGQVSVDISQRSFQERSAHSQPYEWTPSASRSPSAAAVHSTASPLPRGSSAIDAYA